MGAADHKGHGQIHSRSLTSPLGLRHQEGPFVGSRGLKACLTALQFKLPFAGRRPGDGLPSTLGH